MRGCLIGLALLIRFSVLWFMERININLSTEVLRSLSSISWKTPSLVPAYHFHSWDLPSLKQYFTQGPPTLGSSCSRYPYPTFTEFFLCYAHGFIRLRAACWKKRSFHDWFLSDKRSQAYRWNTPHFFLIFWKRQADRGFARSRLCTDGDGTTNNLVLYMVRNDTSKKGGDAPRATD